MSIYQRLDQINKQKEADKNRFRSTEEGTLSGTSPRKMINASRMGLAQGKECPYCKKMFGARAFEFHIKSCARA